jgi:hypothetical protein
LKFAANTSSKCEQFRDSVYYIAGLRFPNLSRRWALEAVEMTRRRRANFHQGPERRSKSPRKPNIWLATDFISHPSKRHFARGSVHISHTSVGSGFELIGRRRAAHMFVIATE